MTEPTERCGRCPLHLVRLIRRRPAGARGVSDLHMCPVGGCGYWRALVFGIETTRNVSEALRPTSIR